MLHNELQCAFDRNFSPLYQSPCLSASLSLRVSDSLLFSNILPEPLGSRAGGAGQWERDSVLFSPRTIRAGKGWSQCLARTPPPCLLWAPPGPALTRWHALSARRPGASARPEEPSPARARKLACPQPHLPPALFPGGITFCPNRRSSQESHRPLRQPQALVHSPRPCIIYSGFRSWLRVSSGVAATC